MLEAMLLLPVTPAARHPARDESGLLAILAAVTAASGRSRTDVLSQRRHGPLADARHAYVVLARERTLASWPLIGRVLGGRDHSTVMKMADARRVTPAVAEIIAGARARLDAGGDAGGGMAR